MGVKTNVFASQSEQRNFKKLARVWGNDYRIYHNLPFLNIFTPQGLIDWTNWWEPKTFALNDVEYNRLKKTSVDFTLCDQNDRPLVCIEFDGLQEGFNVGTQYFADQMKFGPNPWRQEITELKLKVAHGSYFPYFVVGSEQFADISPQIKFTIVDGLIGDVLANIESSERIMKGPSLGELGLSEEEFESIDQETLELLCSDWAMAIEIDAELSNNPLARMRMEFGDEIIVESWVEEHLMYPPCPVDASVSERALYFRNAQKLGRRLIFHTNDLGDVTSTVWLSNFKSPRYSGLGLLHDLAYIVAAEKLLKIRRRTGS